MTRSAMHLLAGDAQRLAARRRRQDARQRWATDSFIVYQSQRAVDREVEDLVALQRLPPRP